MAIHVLLTVFGGAKEVLLLLGCSRLRLPVPDLSVLNISSTIVFSWPIHVSSISSPVRAGLHSAGRYGKYPQKFDGCVDCGNKAMSICAGPLLLQFFPSSCRKIFSLPQRLWAAVSQFPPLSYPFYSTKFLACDIKVFRIIAVLPYNN